MWLNLHYICMTGERREEVKGKEDLCVCMCDARGSADCHFFHHSIILVLSCHAQQAGKARAPLLLMKYYRSRGCIAAIFRPSKSSHSHCLKVEQDVSPNGATKSSPPPSPLKSSSPKFHGCRLFVWRVRKDMKSLSWILQHFQLGPKCLTDFGIKCPSIFFATGGRAEFVHHCYYRCLLREHFDLSSY